MEDDKICEVGHFFKFHFEQLLVNWFKPKPSVIQKKNLYYTTYTKNIFIIPWI